MLGSRVKEGDIVRHFKGRLYEVICVARNTETSEDLVIYQDLESPEKKWARPIEMFEGKVDRDKYIDAEQEFRFEVVDK